MAYDFAMSSVCLRFNSATCGGIVTSNNEPFYCTSPKTHLTDFLGVKNKRI